MVYSDLEHNGTCIRPHFIASVIELGCGLVARNWLVIIRTVWNLSRLLL